MRKLLLLAGAKSSVVAEAPPVPVKEIFRRFWPYLRPYRRWIPVGLLMIAVGVAITTVEIWLFKSIVDGVLVPGNLEPLIWIAGAYAGLLLMGAIASLADDYIATWVAENFVLDLRCDTLAHAQSLSPSFLDQQHLGDLLSRLTGDVRAIEEFVVEGVSAALSAGLRIIFFTTALFILQWQLALVALITAPLLWIGTRICMNWIKEASRDQRRFSGSVTAVAAGALANHALVTASNRQDYEVERLRTEGQGALRTQLATARIGGLLNPMVDLAELVGMMTIVLLGSLAVSDGSLTLGGLLIFVTYLGKLYSPVRDLGSLGETVFEAAAGAERVIEVLDEKPGVVERADAVDLGRAKGRISFEAVDFTYGPDTIPVLSDFSLELVPGEMVALTGPSGSGKSTAAKMMMRLHDPTSGRLMIDGRDMRDATLESLRRNVSVLLQEALIVRGSVRENIKYARPDASDEEMIEAAVAAGAHEFIQALPDGYASDLGERGRSLSSGQRQRVAIARALLADAPVLVLDEPSTGLDAASRDELVAPLRRLTAGRTTLLISHDPRLIEQADRSVRIDGGRAIPTTPLRDNQPERVLV